MVFAFDAYELDADRLELRRAGSLVKADALVLRLLAALVQDAGELVTKEELVDRVWDGRAVADNVITVSMARLRKTLGDRRGEREFVVTVYGRGYRFVCPVAERGASVARQSQPPDAAAPGQPFVGREPVLARLRHALAEANAGRGRLCVLMGEAGIGKTRAVETLERELGSAGPRMAWGFCREAGDTPPLWPWLSLLRELLAVTPDLERDMGPLAAEVQQLLRAPAAAEPGPGLAGAVSGASRHFSFDVLLRTLTLAAERSPRVLVLDDLHRADAASLELLSLLLDAIGRTRLLVIATLRPALGRLAPRPETFLPQVLGHRNCERIALERLNPSAVADYVAALLEDRDGRIARAVYDKSEGNPFYMTELARQLQDSEQPDPSSLVVPTSALELLRQRLSRLHAETRAVLQTAAVIGRSFELPLLSALIGQEPSAVMTSLDDALANEVLVAAPESLTAFAFAHELLRKVLYDGLPPRDQRALHLQVGRALEQRQRDGDSIPASELAYHFHTALPDGDLQATVEHCRAAAAASAALFANADVIRYARHALEALELLENPSVRLRMGLLFTIALYARGHASVEFGRAIREVVRLARERGDGPMLARAAGMLNVNPGLAPMPGVSALLEQALGLLDPGDDEARAASLAALACSAPACFDAARAEVLLAESEVLARRSGAVQPLHVSLRAQLYLRGGPAQRARAEQTEHELERLAQQHPNRLPIVPAQLAIHRAMVALQQGEPDALAAALVHARQRCDAVRERELRWHSRRFQVLARINTGDWAAGAAELEALHREAEQRAILGTPAFCAFDRVVVFGELAESPLDEPLRRALDYEASAPPSLWSLKLRALASADLIDEARAQLRVLAPQDLRRLPCDVPYLGTLGHLARAALRVGALDYAETVSELLSPYPDLFSGHASFLCEGAVPQLLGMLAHALGRTGDAIGQLELGIAMNDRAGFAPRAAEARQQLARCLFERAGSGDRRRAQALLQEAHTGATRMGMRRLLWDTTALLREHAGG